MEPKRTLHSGNLVRGFHVGDRKLFMEKYYDPEKYMELGTCFVREDGRKKNELGRLGDFRSKISYKRRSSLVRGTFYRLCQGAVSSKMGRYEEALKIAQRQEELQRQN